KAGLGLQNHAHRADGGQATVGSRRGEHRGVVYSGYEARERVRLEASRIQQIVLEELAGLGLHGWLVKVRFRVGLCRKLTVRAARQLNEPILQRTWEI